MRNFFVVVLWCSMCTLAFSQKYESQINDSLNSNLLEKVQISKVTINTFKNLVWTSNKKTKIIYFASITCPSSVEFTPLLNKLYKNNQNIKSFELYVVSTKRENYMEKLYNYLFYNGYYFPVFMLSKSSYREILKELCPSCNQKFMGYGNFFILNESNELIIQTDFNFTKEEKFEQIKKSLAG